MTRQDKITAASFPLSGGNLAGASRPSPALECAPAIYSYRTADCAECDGSGEVGFCWRDGFEDTRRCEDCNGSGETDASCCVCNVVRPLDSDGYCMDCLAPSILHLEARHLGGDRWGVSL